MTSRPNKGASLDLRRFRPTIEFVLLVILFCTPLNSLAFFKDARTSIHVYSESAYLSTYGSSFHTQKIRTDKSQSHNLSPFIELSFSQSFRTSRNTLFNRIGNQNSLSLGLIASEGSFLLFNGVEIKLPSPSPGQSDQAISKAFALLVYNKAYNAATELTNLHELYSETKFGYELGQRWPFVLDHSSMYKLGHSKAAGLWTGDVFLQPLATYSEHGTNKLPQARIEFRANARIRRNLHGFNFALEYARIVSRDLTSSSKLPSKQSAFKLGYRLLLTVGGTV